MTSVVRSAVNIDANLTAYDGNDISSALAGDTVRPESNRAFSKSDTDVSAFHEELRHRNFEILFWTNVLFNPALIIWGFLDRFMVPDTWVFFLGLRVVGLIVNFSVLLAVYKLDSKRRTWEGMWALIFVLCAVVSLMLPFSGESFSLYVLGYVVIVFGAGVIPIWPPRWGISVLLSSVAFTCLILLVLSPNLAPAEDILGNSFVVTTAVGLSLVATIFKYDLVRRDYLSRMQLSAVARKESEARMSLARTSDDLQQALEKLKELDRLKSKFFANISHELRTPLTLILAPVDQLSNDVTDSNHKQQLRVIRRNAERLLGLINDLLDLSRLDAGGLRLNLARIDIRSVAAAVHENSRPAAVAKSLRFVLDADSSERTVLGDAHRLEIVLTNLVSNAIKFTPNGGQVEIRIRDIQDLVRVEVEDTGPGIPADDLPRVFERFFQVTPGDRRREGGVGIGLALAKELVELHGGGISVESEPHKFTRFRIDLPFGDGHIRPEVIERRAHFEWVDVRGRRAEDDLAGDDRDRVILSQVDDSLSGGAEPVVFEGARRPRVMLVEDHDDVRDFIRALLDQHFELTLAANGREAWDLLQGDPPDLVVSDVMMPEMSGTELCRAIKGNRHLKSTPVILLTARVGSEATLEAYAHGADDFVAKPFHPRVLMARIRAQLRLRALGLQLAQQEKLAVVGTLAAGILHEVRNPLNAVINASRVLSEGIADPATSKKLIEVISDGAQRIDGIASALDSHARPAEDGMTSACDIREGLDSTIRLLSHRLTDLKVHREYKSDRIIQAPAGPLNQVFLNLVDNAARAGAANIWLSVTEEDERADVLRVAVGDDGPGVPSAESERVFDPFYTKRSDGSGTGLGLYLSRRIVEELGGSLQYEDREGGGALFVVRIPILGVANSSGASGQGVN